jgi:hypothetical protein
VRKDGRWVLIDLDGSAVFGFPVGDRTSTGYSPPEWARVLYGAVPPQDVLASPAFDVWCAAARWARGRPCIAQVST